MARKGRPPKPKKVAIEFIPPVDDDGNKREPYQICKHLVATVRADLAQVNIGFAWRIGWKRDRWGDLKVGQCKKRNDLDRELGEYDFVILLNKEAWPTFSACQKERLIFHELCHAAVDCDDGGDEKRDEAGRLVISGRKSHDVQDFRAVIERYGWTEDLSDLAQKGIADANRPLLHGLESSGEIRDTNDEIRDEPRAPSDEVETLTLKFPGRAKRSAAIEVRCVGDGDLWQAGYGVSLGNYQMQVSVDGFDPLEGATRQIVVGKAFDSMVGWLRDLELTGEIPAARRLEMVQQIEAQRPQE